MADERTLETYRSLRDTIKHVGGDEPIRSVLVVDVDRKTPSAVARRLAEAFQGSNERCVLIHTNLRSPASETWGLSDLIVNPEAKLDFDDSAGPTEVGPGTVPNPDLISSRSFEPALHRIMEPFDYAIVTCDGYPASGDAIAVGPAVDAAIFVISAGVTGREPAIRVRDALERVGTRILGMVMVERPRRWF